MLVQSGGVTHWKHQDTPTLFPCTCCSAALFPAATCVIEVSSNESSGRDCGRSDTLWLDQLGDSSGSQNFIVTLHCDHAQTVGGRPLTPTLTQELWGQTDVSKHAGVWWGRVRTSTLHLLSRLWLLLTSVVVVHDLIPVDSPSAVNFSAVMLTSAVVFFRQYLRLSAASDSCSGTVQCK